MFRFLSFLSVLAICGTLMTGMYVWTTGQFPFVTPPPVEVKTDDQIIDAEELDYLTAIIAHSFGYTKEDKPKLMAGLAARHTATGLNLSYRAVFYGYNEQISPGSKKTWLMYRRLDWIKKETAGAPWSSSRKIAEMILRDKDDKLSATLPETERCVTTFVRARKGDPRIPADQDKMTGYKSIFQLPDGAHFLCLPFPKPEGKKDQKT